MLRFIDAEALVSPGDGVLLAVSGGPDSLALLHLMARLRPRRDLNLTAAYVAHHMRPHTEVAEERDFVADQAAAAGLPFVWREVIDGEAGGGKRSPEDAARQGRYRALARLAAEAGARRVATGHTRTDQAETVLLRLLRGAGLTGLAAMRPDAPWPAPDAPRLIRPLLSLTRADTEAYCAALGLTPRRDPENANPRYQRTHVRAEVLPALRALNPRVDAALANLAAEAAAWSDALRACAGGELTDTERTADEGESGGSLDVAALRRLDAARRRIILHAAIQRVRPDHPAPSRAHLVALDRLALGPAGRSVDLGRGVHAWRERDRLLLGSPAPVAPLPSSDLPVPIDGELVLSGWRIRTVSAASVAAAGVAGPWRAVVDAAAVAGLVVGKRRPGDRIEPAGMRGRKRLQDLFVDERVPRDQRDSRPVFRAGRGIAWVAGLRVAGWARPADGAVLVIEVRPVGKDGAVTPRDPL